MSTTTTWQQQMRKMKLDDIRQSSKAFFEASGGYMMLTKPYSDKTMAGLTKCIIDYLKFKGNYATRTGSAYQPRIHERKRYSLFTEKVEVLSEELRWEKKPNAQAGIETIICGRTVKISVKPGYEKVKVVANTDVTQTLHITVRNMESFIEWFESLPC